MRLSHMFSMCYTSLILFSQTEMQRYVDAFRTPEGELYLNYYGLTEKERKRWKVNFQTRLETNNLYELIRDDLTESDIEKIERNKKIFG